MGIRLQAVIDNTRYATTVVDGSEDHAGLGRRPLHERRLLSNLRKTCFSERCKPRYVVAAKRDLLCARSKGRPAITKTAKRVKRQCLLGFLNFFQSSA